MPIGDQAAECLTALPDRISAQFPLPPPQPHGLAEPPHLKPSHLQDISFLSEKRLLRQECKARDCVAEIPNLEGKEGLWRNAACVSRDHKGA